MFQFTIRLAEDGDKAERIRIIADSRDVLKWEKAKPGRSVTKILAEPNIVDSYILAYLAARRQNLVDCSPNEFESRYLLVFGQEPAPDPTPPVP
jgi:hypothetical protein